MVRNVSAGSNRDRGGTAVAHQVLVLHVWSGAMHGSEDGPGR
jgi:hypothetical protein